MLSIRPLTPRIGAEISGLDLRGTLSDADVARVRGALNTHLVIFFRDQAIDHAQHLAFARRFGPLATHSAVPGIRGHPEIVAIHADASSTFVAGDDWHSDLTCDPVPPMGSILRLETVPPAGGDTLFASMHAAYEALSPRMKVLLEGLTAVHDADHVYRPLFPHIERTYPCSVHPVIRVHPETGRKGLFVNASYVTRIRELPKAESDGLLGFLFEHVKNPNFHVRFSWRPHSIAFWDNRSTQHLATWDYFPQTRSGYRVTIAGEQSVSETPGAPRFTPGRPSTG